MKYEQIWNAVDKLAQSRGLSPSGLAKLGGLDATTFNKSKRVRPDGKKRWPSLDSVNKLLEVCNISFEKFYALGNDGDEKEGFNSIPFIKLSKLTENLVFNDKKLLTEDWNKVIFPDLKDTLYAVDIDNNAYAPLYRAGSMIVIASNSDIRKCDRVVIYLKNESLNLYEFIRRSATNLVVSNINGGEEEINIPINEIRLINRIVWASQ